MIFVLMSKYSFGTNVVHVTSIRHRKFFFLGDLSSRYQLYMDVLRSLNCTCTIKYVIQFSSMYSIISSTRQSSIWQNISIVCVLTLSFLFMEVDLWTAVVVRVLINVSRSLT